MTQKQTKYISTISSLYNNSNEVLVKTKNGQLQLPEETIEKVYNPYEHRKLNHPNNYFGAFVHIVKASLGTGILAGPKAFKSAGLLVGAIGNILIGILCTHTVYILAQASQKACIGAKVPSLGFASTTEEVFKQGPRPIRKWSSFAKLFIEFALITTYYLGIAVYMVFISVSLTKLFSYYYPNTESWDRYIFKLMIMAPLLVLCQIREIKFMVPFSFIANVCFAVSFSIISYYIFSGLTDTDRPKVKLANGLSGFPSFFSTVLFAMEGIGTVMPVENSMPTPNLLGICGVLNTAMTLVVFLFMSLGFFGYYRYGEDTADAITKNLPDDEILAQVAQGALAISIFFTFMLQFHVPTDILWQRLRNKFSENRHNVAQIVLRTLMILLITAIAIAGAENLGSLIDLIGSIFYSSLGLLVPATLDIIVNRNDSYGKFRWKLTKNIIILILAVFGMVSGTYYAILEFQ